MYLSLSFPPLGCRHCCDPLSLPFLSPPCQVQTLGRERSLEGYRLLLSQAGFDPQRVHGMRTGAYLDAVIAYK